MAQLAQQYLALQTEPNAADHCDQERAASSSSIRQINASALATQLGKHWQVIGDYLCPEKTFVYGYTSLSSKLRDHHLTLDELTDFEAVMTNLPKIKTALNELDSFESMVLHEQLYSEIRLNVDQLKTLIEHKLTPKNSDFYSMIFRLPIEQQKLLLVEQQYNLANTNALGFSLITQVFEKALRNPKTSKRMVDELIPYLLSQGVPLTSSDKDIDPLWFKLHSLNNHEDPNAELASNALASLIDHTPINDTHIDAMYKIKNKHQALYQRLVDQFPKLHFDEPNALIEIKCTPE